MKKVRNKRGFTLMETMAAILVMVLLVVGIGTGMDTGLRVYREVTFETDSAALAGMIDTALSDMLRHAENIDPSPDALDPNNQPVCAVFTNVDQGLKDAYIYIEGSGTSSGMLKIRSIHNNLQPVELVNAGAYPDLQIERFNLNYVEPGEEGKRGGYFEVKYTIASSLDSTRTREMETVVRPLNGG